MIDELFKLQDLIRCLNVLKIITNSTENKSIQNNFEN
jgi:hypothetical protein